MSKTRMYKGVGVPEVLWLPSLQAGFCVDKGDKDIKKCENLLCDNCIYDARNKDLFVEWFAESFKGKSDPIEKVVPKVVQELIKEEPS